MADCYAIQLEIIRYVPIPETRDSISDDELPPVFRTIYERLDIK